jgi:hypothetical protein
MKRTLGRWLMAAAALVVLTGLVAGRARRGEGAEPKDAPAAAAPAADPSAKPPADAKKHLVPSEESQAEVQQTLRELFKKEIDNKLPHARLALAADLIRKARESKDKPAEQYVMLRVARDLAVQQGDAILAVLAVDELGKGFDVSVTTTKAEALERTLRQAKTPAAVALVTESILREAEKAADPQAYEALAPLVRQVEASLLKKCGPEMARLLLEQRNRFDDRRDLIRAGQAAVAVLETNADDPGANSERGRFEAMVREDWEKALPLLAKASQGAISESARRLAADAKDVAAQLAMADAWWDLAEKERRPTGYKAMLRTAAQHWYEQALPGRRGPDQGPPADRPLPPRAATAKTPASARIGWAGRALLDPAQEGRRQVRSFGGLRRHPGQVQRRISPRARLFVCP